MIGKIDGGEIAQYNQSMISEQDKAMIVDIARRYDVKGIILFGSSTDPDRDANDIDLAIEGIAPAKFFDFYGELLFALSKPVDLVELSRDSKFNRLVYREGVRLYGQSA
ncbi:MAG: nucleotidyltransferase domain-containing protein [Sedimentisphaerales bacterium]|jgi:predicted nucleotidyltransferase